MPLAGAVIRLNPIAVWIDDKRGIVIIAVYRAQAGRAIVLPASLQRRCMKGVDSRGVRRGKANMQALL